MQATSVLHIPTTSNGVEQAGEAAAPGQGIKISSTLQTKDQDSLFTAILQKGITLNTASDLLLGTAAASGNGADESEKKGTDSVDVCSLLMQLMVMNASSAPTGAGNNNGADGNNGTRSVADVTAQLAGAAAAASGKADKGMNPALSVIQNQGKALETLTGQAESGIPAAAGGQNRSVIAAIAAAIENNLPEDTGTATQQTAQTPGAATNAAATVTANAATASAAVQDADAVLIDSGIKTPGPAGAKQSEERASERGKGTGTAGDIKVSAAAEDASGIPKVGGKTSGLSEKSDNGTGFGTHEKSKTDKPGTATAVIDQTASGITQKFELKSEQAAAVEKALNKFAEDLTNVQSGNQELRIVLEPESLGVLTISVTKTETGVSAKIKSEDRDVVAAISDQLQKLISSMENKGIKLNNIDVVYSQTDFNTGFGQQHSFAQGQNDTPKGYTPSYGKSQDGEGQTGDFWQGYYGDDKNGDYTVDYRI